MSRLLNDPLFAESHHPEILYPKPQILDPTLLNPR